MSRDIRRDLGRHLQEQVGQLIERHLRSAQGLLEKTDLLLLYVEAAVSTAVSAAASTAASVPPDASEEIYDTTISLITHGINSARDRSLAEVRARAGAA